MESGAVKPDIVIWDMKSKTAQIVEVTVPNDFGLNRAELKGSIRLLKRALSHQG